MPKSVQRIRIVIIDTLSRIRTNSFWQWQTSKPSNVYKRVSCPSSTSTPTRLLSASSFFTNPFIHRSPPSIPPIFTPLYTSFFFLLCFIFSHQLNFIGYISFIRDIRTPSFSYTLFSLPCDLPIFLIQDIHAHVHSYVANDFRFVPKRKGKEKEKTERKRKNE